MRSHRNAKLSFAQRKLLVWRVREENWTITEAAEAAGVTRRTVYKWLRRFDEEGENGLEDRSSRPHRVIRGTTAKELQRIERLRRRKRTAYEISQETGIPASTVSLRLQELGLGRIWQAEAPPQRYEQPHPGDLFHIDAKRLARIGCVGHAIHGDYRRRSRGVGWEVVFVCVDDHTRLAYAEVLPAESAKSATAFLGRALRWFASLGIRCRRLMTDNAKCYTSGAFTALCAKETIRQIFTRPYTPKTNGKAERFIQTLKRRWAYRHVYPTSAMRADSLRPWIKHYNHQRPHRSLGNRPPMARLREARAQRA